MSAYAYLRTAVEDLEGGPGVPFFIFHWKYKIKCDKVREIITLFYIGKDCQYKDKILTRDHEMILTFTLI